MLILIYILLAISVLFAIGSLIVVIVVALKNRIIEDAMQAQRERQHAEMWAKINADLKKEQHDLREGKQNGPA